MLFHFCPLICYGANTQCEKQLNQFGEGLEEKGGAAFHNKGLQKDWKQKSEMTFFTLSLASS